MIERLEILKWSDITFNRVVKAFNRRIKYIPERIKWELNLNDRIRKNKIAIENFKNQHKGERCFIIANGPSLSKIDFNLLKNEYTIGMNRIYLLEKNIGFKPDYLVVADVPVQLEQFADEYLNYKGIKFYSYFSKYLFPKDAKELYYFFQHFKNDFSPDFTRTIGNSKSVTHVCIQLAYYLGFDDVILIGKDHSYNISGKVGDHVKATGKEQNHFISGYYAKGQIWAIPNYKEEEYTYSLARKAFEKAGRRIVDATIGGKLKVFEKVDFTSLFK